MPVERSIICASKRELRIEEFVAVDDVRIAGLAFGERLNDDRKIVYKHRIDQMRLETRSKILTSAWPCVCEGGSPICARIRGRTSTRVTSRHFATMTENGS